ncbi:MAG: hypothetical protein ACAI35_21680 [Candidatus Methylacidiphilales bacterium]
MRNTSSPPQTSWLQLIAVVLAIGAAIFGGYLYRFGYIPETWKVESRNGGSSYGTSGKGVWQPGPVVICSDDTPLGDALRDALVKELQVRLGNSRQVMGAPRPSIASDFSAAAAALKARGPTPVMTVLLQPYSSQEKSPPAWGVLERSMKSQVTYECIAGYRHPDAPWVPLHFWGESYTTMTHRGLGNTRTLINRAANEHSKIIVTGLETMLRQSNQLTPPAAAEVTALEKVQTPYSPVDGLQPLNAMEPRVISSGPCILRPNVTTFRLRTDRPPEEVFPELLTALKALGWQKPEDCPEIQPVGNNGNYQLTLVKGRSRLKISEIKHVQENPDGTPLAGSLYEGMYEQWFSWAEGQQKLKEMKDDAPDTLLLHYRMKTKKDAGQAP